MGLFNNIFGNKKSSGKETEGGLAWILLTSLEQLDDIEQKSTSRTQIIFKHSTTCGISRMVLNTFEKNPVLQGDVFDLYFLELQSYRALSNEITQKFNVVHQSPQLLIVKNGKTVAHESHAGITEMDLGKYL